MLQPVQVAVELAAVLVIALVLPLHLGTRLWALVLTLPLGWGATRLLDLTLYGTGVLR